MVILENIDIDIDIDKAILKNIDIDIDIDKENLVNIDIDIDIDKEVLENIDIDIDIDKEILENIDIDIDIDKEISENIDIDKISNRLEFGISNRATVSLIMMMRVLMANFFNVVQKAVHKVANCELSNRFKDINLHSGSFSCNSDDGEYSSIVVKGS